MIVALIKFKQLETSLNKVAGQPSLKPHCILTLRQPPFNTTVQPSFHCAAAEYYGLVGSASAVVFAA